MFIYYDNISNQVAMVTETKIETDKDWLILEVDNHDAALMKMQSDGGKLKVEDGILSHIALEEKPVDIKNMVESSGDFEELKQNIIKILAPLYAISPGQ